MTEAQIAADLASVTAGAGLNVTLNETMQYVKDNVPAEEFSKWGHKIFDTPAEDIVDYEGGWGSYVKIGVIILKVGFIVVMMIMGIIAH